MRIQLTPAIRIIIIAAALVLVALLAYQIGSAAPLAAPASATCRPASWQQRATVYNVRCAGGWCTARVSTCGTWGCAYGSLSGSPRTVYTGRAVNARITRMASCGYTLRVLR